MYCSTLFICCFFFFKQKTAYEMRISDWSSDVCSSDLFSVSNFWPEIERSGATLANLLGSMLAFVADAPDNEAQKRCVGQLRAIRGSPFPPEVREKWRTRFGVKVTGSNVYGLTEASPVTSLHDDDFPKPGSDRKSNSLN